jgi:exopolyphosphatase/guanosine-5'-triphosphate,3'-diphosphate pyrophosphatase
VAPTQDQDAPGPPPIPATAGPGQVIAAADLGSTSAHAVVAAVDGHSLQPLLDESAFLRLGDRLQASPALGAAARGEVVDVLRDWADRARALGADTLTVVGTEPMRRAADAPRIVHEAAGHGVAIHVLDHDEEGILTLLGVTAGMPVGHDVVLVDIGGGSCVLVVVGPERPPVVTGVRIGGGRLTQRHVAHDPPTDEELGRMLADARDVLAAAPAAASSELVAVGGTASNLRKLVTGDPVDPVITRREVGISLDVFTELPAAALTERYLVNPVRARILPAGACIMLAVLERYEAERVRVSEAGIRDGTLFAVARAGGAWRDRLRELAQGWSG